MPAQMTSEDFSQYGLAGVPAILLHIGAVDAAALKAAAEQGTTLPGPHSPQADLPLAGTTGPVGVGPRTRRRLPLAGAQPIRRTMKARPLLLLLAGLLLLGFELAGMRSLESGDVPGFLGAVLAEAAVYAVAVYWVLGRRPAPLWLVLAVAAALRLVQLAAPPLLSTDAYRYVWDGRVQAAGINPYRHIPVSVELQGLRDRLIYPNINRKDYARTIYPPAAQVFFLATTRISETITWMKFSMVLWEALATFLLWKLLQREGRAASELLLYLWHPLPAWEFAGSGHLDAAALACVLAALLLRGSGATALSGVALALGGLFKLYPLALAPVVWRRGDLKMPAALVATFACGYLPYLPAGSLVLGFLPTYVNEEGLDSGTRYYLLQLATQATGVHVPALAYLVLAGLLLLALSLWVALRDGQPGHAGLLLAAAATLLLSPHYAWYLAWLLPLAVLARSVPVLLLGATSFLLYHSLLEETPEVALQTGHLLYAPFVLLLALEALRMRSQGATVKSPA